LFELQLNAVLNRNVPEFKELSRFPVVRRDLAVIVKDDIPAEKLVNTIQKSAGEVINKVTIFDVYHGKGVESGYKSVALALILQDKSKTLAETEIDAIVSKVIAYLEKQFDARLRD
jgi:phenylalanyl-tRNA synthetase beta chain